MNEARGARIVVIGGGTGSFTMLSGLKHYTAHITALVNMVDDGGSTGTLRDELGVLPPGDVRQCLVALSDSPKVRDLFNYRFEDGTLKGHAFGNLFLTALEKLTGDFAVAVETAADVLRVEGTVVPVTLDNVRLVMSWPDRQLVLNGERVIDVDHFRYDPRQATLSLSSEATTNPAALEAIKSADIIVIAPGDLYTSLGPVLVAPQIQQALMTTLAKIVYVCNLVTKRGQTDDFRVSDFASEIERFAGGLILDYVVYNTAHPSSELLERYAHEGEYAVQYNQPATMASYKVIGVDLLAAAVGEQRPGDELAATRSLIRHDPDKAARQIMKLYFD